MITFGLTGGIASGKSTVARLFERWGVPVVDADRVAREVVAVQTPALLEIEETFGSSVLREDGALDRVALGRLVFAQPEQRARLNSIVHPRIKERVAARLKQLGDEGHALACYDVPLLFETQQQKNYRPVVVVAAPDTVRIQRIMERDGLDEEAAQARLDSQIPLATKVAAADFVVENSADLDALKAAARSVLEQVRRWVKE